MTEKDRLSRQIGKLQKIQGALPSHQVRTWHGCLDTFIYQLRVHSEVIDQRPGEFAGLHLLRPLHLAGEIVGHDLLGNRFFVGFFD